MTQQPVINTFILRVPTPRAQTPTPIHNNQPPPIPMNTKPNRRKGRSELYEDQFGNACNTDICLLEQIGSSKQCKLLNELDWAGIEPATIRFPGQTLYH